jgi:DNA processing protein
VGAAAAPLEGGPTANARAALAWLETDGHDLIVLTTPTIPDGCSRSDPPPTLYCLGRRELLGRPALAIVGSRNAMPQGVADARAFARALSDAGLTIVSGSRSALTRPRIAGLDGASSSIAVTGTGLDRVTLRKIARSRTSCCEGLLD